MSPDLKTYIYSLIDDGPGSHHVMFTHSQTTTKELNDEAAQIMAHKTLAEGDGVPCFCLEPCGGFHVLTTRTRVYCRELAYGWCGADCQGCGPMTGCYLKAEGDDIP